MRILQLCPQVPYPLSEGAKVGIFNITKYLAQRGHHITMLAFENEEVEEKKPLEEICELTTVRHSTKNSSIGALLNLFSDLPYNSSKYLSRPYVKALGALLEKKVFDVVHVDHLHMSPYGIFCKEQAKLPIVLREHNVESVILERFTKNVRNPFFRQWLNIQMKRIRSYESRVTAQFDLCCVITEEDRKRIHQLNSEIKTSVISAGVEDRYFQAEAVEHTLPNSIALLGNFEWAPNRDALIWFVDKIFPRIVRQEPRAKLFVIGKGIPGHIHTRNNQGIIVKGFTSDILEELRQYDLTVVPLRVGGGIRLKILESFAMRVPVVSTSVGCEGILCKDEQHLLIADTEDRFVVAVLRLFRDRELRGMLTEKAFKVAYEQYRWERVAEEFERAYVSVIPANIS